MDVQADNVSFGESKRAAQENGGGYQGAYQQPAYAQAAPAQSAPAYQQPAPQAAPAPQAPASNNAPGSLQLGDLATSKRSSATAKFPSDQANENTALQIGG